MEIQKYLHNMKNTGERWRDKFEEGMRASFCSGHETEISDRRRKLDERDGKKVVPIGPEKRRRKKDSQSEKKKKKKYQDH